MPHPHATLKIIALLDHKQLSADELAEHLGKTPKTVLNQTANLVKWGQIEVVDERIQTIPNGRLNRRGKAVLTQVRTRVFKATDRGRARLNRKGGHRMICPECTPQKGKAKR